MEKKIETVNDSVLNAMPTPPTTELVWDDDAHKIYENGISDVILYKWNGTTYSTGTAWPGVISISESLEGGEPTALYADNIKYLELMSLENVKASIETYEPPREFSQCVGVGVAGAIGYAQQTKKKFCLAYITKVGSSSDPDAGEKLHFLYNCLATGGDKSYQTINESPNAMTFSYSITTTPEVLTGYKSTALLVIDKSQAVAAGKTTAYNTVKALITGTTHTYKTPAEILAYFA